ncbi:MAG: RNA polymerase sigma-70 factor [Proteiniphilum sp.]|nr:RNA polymerase sigma-70 factor [Proteiniphilum sp.]MDD3908855.1 RNA polymerase sigma-70 factor [Proteiniphilum sp.]
MDTAMAMAMATKAGRKKVKSNLPRSAGRRRSLSFNLTPVDCYRPIYYMDQTSADKIEKLLERKFEEFFMCHFPKVKNFAWKLLKSEHDAEDIAQEIFLKLWKTPGLWSDNPKALDSYLYKMTKNKVIDLIRQRYSEPGHATDTFYDAGLPEAAVAGSTLPDIYYKETGLIIRLSLEQMPAQRRRIFEMSRFAGMSNRQIAEELGLSVRTVEHHIYLALAELKKKLIFAFLLLFL